MGCTAGTAPSAPSLEVNLKQRAYPVALASGAALSFAFPEPNLAPLAWIAIAPLLWVLRGAGVRRGFALGYVFGLGFFAVLIYWISIIGVIAWVVLVLIQAGFIGLFGAFWGRLSSRAAGWERIVIPAALWVVFVEYFRANFLIIGFTWGELAQSQHNMPWLLRPASIGGAWLVAFLLLAVNGLLVEAVASFRKRGEALRWFAGAGALLLAPLLIPANSAGGETLRVGIVQGNVPRDLDVSYEKDLVILQSHVHLTKELAGEVDLAVWPETAVAEDLFREEEFAQGVEDAARTLGAPMIVGGTIERDDDRYQVMAFEVSPAGEVVDQYQKTHLVPFGEYVPARAALDWIPALAQVPRDAVPGNKGVVFDLDGRKIAPVISFEGDFGSLVRRRIDAGGRLLVVATNTSTWGDSWASAQHVAMSQVRAAENGVFVVHAALSGISALIEPTGEVIDRTPLWTPTTLVGDVGFAESITLYARIGDWLPLTCIVGSLVWILMVRRRRPGTVGE